VYACDFNKYIACDISLPLRNINASTCIFPFDKTWKVYFESNEIVDNLFVKYQQYHQLSFSKCAPGSNVV
jgi:hypothetical protein